MLDGLDAVAWATLSHAYGSAEDLPSLLREAAADDPERREEAVQELFGTVWHQGTVYSATPHAVPFIAELAVHGPGHRGDMLHLLACVVEGGDDCGGDAEAVEAGRRAVCVLLTNPSDLSRLSGLPGLAGDADREVREAWLRVVAACGSGAAPLLPLLDERLRVESDPVVRADVVTTFSKVDPSAASVAARLRPLERDPAPQVRFAALTEMVRGTPTPYPEDLVARAVDARLAATPIPERGWPELNISFEDLLAEDVGAALFATAHAAAAGSRWSLAFAVDEIWRDRESDVLPWYFEDLRSAEDDRRTSHALARIARAAAAAPALAAPYIEVLSRYAADDHEPSTRAAAVTALARAGSVEAIDRCVHLVRDAPGDHGTDPAVAATVEVFAERAEPVALAIAERLRDAAGGSAGTGDRTASAGGHRDTEMIMSLRAFPDLAETLVADLVTLLESDHSPHAVVLLLESLGPRAQAAVPALLEVARGSDETFMNLVAATAYFRITGDSAVALDLFDRRLRSEDAQRVYGRVGVLGRAALPLLPRLEGGLRAGIDWARVGAAESIWRITGRVEDTVPVIASEAQKPDTNNYGNAQADAIRALTEIGLVPGVLLPDLRLFADSPRRLVHDGTHDGTPHKDNTARDAVRHLLSTAEASPLPVAPPIPDDDRGWGPW
ncbi:hypothetical protein [Yinghuangia sp. YIM S09857]|uniref:hypothetical protein n=1 Tax=Yinghuangia sp. YIM S09857 TaxID=3436929 RepID=UPI003F52F113